MQRVVKQIERYARYEHAMVLLEGPSGVGKSTIAELLHRRSPRRNTSFHTVDLGALDDGLAGSSLFGHVTGAFTDAKQQRQGAFAAAHGGTLFLDEIGKAQSGVQRKLLRVIERGEVAPLGSDRIVRVDVRLVLASSADLSVMAARGEFLPDLVARVEAFRVRVPPLRERVADIPLLVTQIIAAWAASCGHERPPEVDAELMRELQAHPWPNNLRQLDGLLRRLLIDAEGSPVLTVEHWRQLHVDLGTRATDLPRRAPHPPTPEEVRAAYSLTRSIRGAAMKLGIPRTTLYHYLPDDLRRAAMRQEDAKSDLSGHVVDSVEHTKGAGR